MCSINMQRCSARFRRLVSHGRWRILSQPLKDAQPGSSLYQPGSAMHQTSVGDACSRAGSSAACRRLPLLGLAAGGRPFGLLAPLGVMLSVMALFRGADACEHAHATVCCR